MSEYTKVKFQMTINQNHFCPLPLLPILIHYNSGGTSLGKEKLNSRMKERWRTDYAFSFTVIEFLA